MPQLAWGAVVTQPFISALRGMCIRLKWNNEQANFIMACMAFESGESFSPSIRNAAGSGAVGLIQFMPGTAQGLGTTSRALAAMSQVEQLEYVEKYFKPYAKRCVTLSDMYMAILMPAFVGALGDAVLFRSPGVAYRQNSGLDADVDGIITKTEATAKVFSKLNKGLSIKCSSYWEGVP